MPPDPGHRGPGWPVSMQMQLQRGLGPFQGGFMEEGGNG